MNSMKKILLSCVVMTFITGSLSAKENFHLKPGKGGSPGGNQVLSNCQESKAITDLSINNVRTLIFINGDMWWDLAGSAKYEIPKDSKKNSLFAGAIWIGGIDGGGSLKMAAQTYRQSGSDFWPGPLDTTTVDIGPDECFAYDKHWKVTRQEVEQFVDYYKTTGGAIDDNLVPESIKTWPGNGNDSLHQGHNLAPYVEVGGDPNYYNYLDGDYPAYNLSNTPSCDNTLLGDETLWWVFNDVGNIHTETNGSAIGLEVRAQAFAFSTNDEINNMTFYKFQIINRSNFSLNEAYFGAWVDPDLGNYVDDYVGCDVKRGFGYCYNGDANDEGILGYGLNPPAVGYDFFEGPIADANDLKDNDRDGVVDEAGEKIIMSKFVYYNNDFTVIGNPVDAPDYYNYLKGIWKDGTVLTYGGNGHQSGGDTCDFMFPGDTDPLGVGTNGVPQLPWDEASSGNIPADRRFLQSAGPFTLQAGAVNYITTGAVWARTSSGGNLASVKLVRLADDKAQALFDNCFSIINGPDAPDITIRELDKELILSISNGDESANNYKEQYKERDPYVKVKPDSFYVFEGYQIYQLKDNTVSVTDLDDPDKARLVIQCDIKNSKGQIVNQYFDAEKSAFTPVEEVLGADAGLRHTFKITTDKFAEGDDRLVNHKVYYYTAIAYAYCGGEENLDCYVPEDGQCQPYKAGRRNILTYTAIPHIPDPELGGVYLNAVFGNGPEITRKEGTGNGYNLGSDRLTLDLKQEAVNEILSVSSGYRSLYPTYESSRGPIDVRVYDPIAVKPAKFDLWLNSVNDTGKWIMKNVDTGELDTAEKSIKNPNDQIFPDFGMSVSINQVVAPGVSPSGGNGFIEATIEYENPSSQWLSGLSDLDNSIINWILAGKDSNETFQDAHYNPVDKAVYFDPDQVYEKLLGGTWTPYKLCASPEAGLLIGPASNVGNNSALLQNQLSNTGSIDLVITSDKSKWSKCAVVEMQNDPSLAIGSATRLGLRKSASLDINGNPTSGTGMSYFPGYAINVETGERLNIVFGEDSYDTKNNGNDMKWNPTSDFWNQDGNTQIENLSPGGKHVIFVFGHNGNLVTDVPLYDECAFIASKLSNPTTVNLRTWKDCMWVGYSMLTAGENLEKNINSNETRVRLRVARPYAKYLTDNSNNTLPSYSFDLGSLSPVKNNAEKAKSALDLINIVPNPYYAFSEYEGTAGVAGQLDNRVRIVNLPAKCTITIYSVNGTVVRQLRRDTPSDNTAGSDDTQINLETSVDWDLKNSTGIPVASGIYIIHVDAPGIGEKTIKWFGVLRPIDLDSF